MPVAKEKQVKLEAFSKKRKQVYDIFRGQLNGACLNECTGPCDNSSLEWWCVGKQLIIVQIWADGSGWEYYLAGREGKIDEIVKQIDALR